ncbi:hypothetical protein FJZ31_40810 [Candidatus Poribacteria bacterium]|nr:hypothetical protein [Candidatus Poribacteria bacterium]
MKSYTQRIGRALLISLVLHLSIAIALMFVTFTKVDNKREMPFLSVSFIKLESQKTLIPRVAPLVPPVQPISPSKLKSGDFSHQFLPTVTSPKSRSNITGVSKSSSELVANVTPTSHGVRLGAADLPVTNQAVAQDKTSALAHLPTEPSAVESRQLKSELAFGETGAAGSEVGQGQDSNINKQRGVFPKGVQVESTSAKMSGIGSLVSKSQVANEDDVLADITDNVVLGGEIPSLPKGEPGGIIVGRGNDIKGRLNLVRLNDPLHPSLYG